ncbi:MAG TPA: DnaB-like helicase C-terminal domain-containing protein [Spirochaetota bacterium]|nr:DnaB-like helicase C-terminal domain-containing protein [Spirochaetota bacterium]
MIDHKLEGGVLGSALNNHLIAADLCQISDGFFAHREHNVLHSVIRRCVQSTGKCGLTDIQAFLSDIPDRDELNAYFASLYAKPQHATTTSAKIALDQLREYYKRRKVAESAELMKSELVELGAEIAIANHEKRMREVETNESGLKTMRCHTLEELLEKDPCLPTGIPALDSGIVGIPINQMTTIAARPSVGKTAFILSIMRHIVKTDKHIIFFSQETKVRSLMQRIFAAEVGMSLSRFRSADTLFNDSEKEKIAKFYYGADWLDRIHVYDKPCDMSKLFSLSKKSVDNDKSCLIAVDHVGLVQGMNSKYVRREQIGEYSAFCRAFVSDNNVAWVNLWQLNRVAADEEPELHHLKDSGSGEEDSDLVLLLSANEEDEANNRLNINVAKQRQGSKFKLSSKNNNPVYFNRSRMIIGDSPRILEF